jgi:uncharacterized protein YjbI with pentapeptide repeats
MTPPDGGAVIRNGDSVLVLPATGVAEIADLPCGDVVSHPTAISVAAPAFHNTTYAAISFEDKAHGLISAWGARSINSTSPVELYPGRADFTPTTVRVWTGMDSKSDTSVDAFLRSYFSCRQCMLIRYGLGNSDPSDASGMIRIEPHRNVAFVGDLSGANLYQANLHFVDPNNSTSPNSPNLGGVNLGQADLSEVAGLSGAWLQGTQLNGTNLIETDLSYAQLTGANLQRAALIKADLSGANLANADLSGANLDGANLDGANLDGANTSGTIMSQASDGQSLAAQAPAVQATFKATHGDMANARWLAEHEAALRSAQ